MEWAIRGMDLECYEHTLKEHECEEYRAVSLFRL